MVERKDEPPMRRIDVLLRVMAGPGVAGELRLLKQPGLSIGDESVIYRNVAKLIDMALAEEVEKRRLLAPAEMSEPMPGAPGHVAEAIFRCLKSSMPLIRESGFANSKQHEHFALSDLAKRIEAVVVVKKA